MSRQHQSPLDRQPPNPFPSGQPPSFKTNVNRSKTKKWVEAKPLSYEGDDWGDYDEDDEYGVESQPMVPPKPVDRTGLRQTGQGMDVTGDPGRSFSQPMHRTDSFDAGDERRNFSSGQHRPPLTGSVRSTHVSGAQPGQHQYPNYPPAPGPLYVQTNVAPARATPSPGYGPRGETPSGGRQIPIGSWTQLAVNEGPPLEFQQRRDFSPSAMPPPLHTRASPTRISPAPSSLIEPPAGARFPPRKSSLSQQIPPIPPTAAASPVQRIPNETAPSQASELLSNSPTKPLPFIRPADIYKRMEEARRKERESIELPRPDVDISAAQASIENVDSPLGEAQEQPSSVILERSHYREPSLDPVSEINELPPASVSNLEPVPERNQSALERKSSEYGLPGFSVTNPVLAAALGANVFQTSVSHGDAATDAAMHTHTENDSAQRSEPWSLAAVSGTSAFSDDFSSSHQLPDEVDASALEKNTPVQTSVASGSLHREQGNLQSKLPLQHHPSLGFRSAVHEAFDRKDDSSVPPTPISRRGDSLSDPGTSVSRSNTGSTAGISPIMSRVPEGPAAPVDIRTTGASTDEPPTAMIVEPNRTTTARSRPTSVATLRDMYQFPKRSSPAHSRNESAETLPRPHTPAYGRDLNTPSPGNSPARSPAIEAHQPLPEPKTAEFDVTGPVSPVEAPAEHGQSHGDYAQDHTAREFDLARIVGWRPGKEGVVAGETARLAQSAFLDSRKDAATSSFAPASPMTGSLLQRADSPTKGRVRDLAGKFNEIADSRRNSVQSTASKKSLSSWNQSRENLSLPPSSPSRSREPSPSPERASVTGIVPAPSPTNPTHSEAARPAADRSVSFRPRLPGQWESYVTTAGPISRNELPEEPQLAHEAGKEVSIGRSETFEEAGRATPSKTVNLADENIDITPTTNKRSAVPDEPPRLTEDPLAALRAAGTAIGEALMASVGLDQPHKASEPPNIGGAVDDERQDRQEDAQRRSSVGNVYIRPLAVDRAASSVTSSVSPTPPPKDLSAAAKSDYLGEATPKASLKGTPSRDIYDIAPLSATGPTTLPHLNQESSMQDLESDRLREEIERSLNFPTHFKTVKSGTALPDQHSNTVAARRWLDSRESGVIPSGYEQYWNMSNAGGEATRGGTSTERPGSAEESIRTSQAPTYTEPKQEPYSAAGPDLVGRRLPNESGNSVRPAVLSKRFSWEKSDADLSRNASDSLRGSGSVAAATDAADYESPRASSSIKQLLDEDPKLQGSDSIRDAYAGTAGPGSAEQQHSVPADPEAAQRDMIKQLPSLPQTVVNPPDSPRISRAMDSPPRSRPVSGLHVVNDVVPEPVELPARLSMDTRPTIEARLPSPKASPTQPSFVEAEGQQPAPQPPSPAARIPAFREILALKSPEDRIKSYDSAREQFANLNTGLDNWLNSTFASHVADPEYAAIARIGTRPNVTTSGPSGSLRGHKALPSLSGFTKHSPSSAQGAQTPYYQQYLDSAAQVPGSAAGSPAASVPQSQSPSPIGGGKIIGKDVQAKGKDLLHSAGVLGGKATTGAKGLFAKGKYRLKGGVADKAPKPSTSNEDTTTSSSASGRGLSPFRRQSSRPSSIVLPQTEDFTGVDPGSPLVSQSHTPSATPLTSLTPPPLGQGRQWRQGLLGVPRGGTPERLSALSIPGFGEGEKFGILEMRARGGGQEVVGTRGERSVEIVDRRSIVAAAEGSGMQTLAVQAEETRPLSLRKSRELETLTLEVGSVGFKKPLEQGTGLAIRSRLDTTTDHDLAEQEGDVRTPPLDPIQLGSVHAMEAAAEGEKQNWVRHYGDRSHGSESQDAARFGAAAGRGFVSQAGGLGRSVYEDVEGDATVSNVDTAKPLGGRADAEAERTREGVPTPMSTPDSWEKGSTASDGAAESVHNLNSGKDVAPAERAYGVDSVNDTKGPRPAASVLVSECAIHANQPADGVVQESSIESWRTVPAHNRPSEGHRMDDAPVSGDAFYQSHLVGSHHANEQNEHRGSTQEGQRLTSYLPNGQDTHDKPYHEYENEERYLQATVPTQIQPYNLPANQQQLASQPLTQLLDPGVYVPNQHDAEGPPRMYDEGARYPPASSQQLGYPPNGPIAHQRSASQPLTDLQPDENPAEDQLLGRQGIHWQNQRPPVPLRNSFYGFDAVGFPAKDVVPHIGHQAFTRQAMDPRQHSTEYQLPGVGPPSADVQDRRLKKTSVFFNGLGNRNSPAPVAVLSRERINPQLTAPAPYRGFSYQSSVGTVDSGDIEQQRKRRSGFFSFNRSSSNGAASHPSGQNTPRTGMSQADRLAQSSGNPALAAASSVADAGSKQIADSKATKKLQRATSSTTPDPEKKKSRFSVLGTIFGRSSSTGHTQRPNKLTKANSKSQRALVESSGTLEHNATVYEDAHDRDYARPPMSNRRSSGWRQEMEREFSGPRQPAGLPREAEMPPPGGFYAPAEQSEFEAIPQQQRQANEGRQMPGQSSYSYGNASVSQPGYRDGLQYPEAQYSNLPIPRLQSNGAHYYGSSLPHYSQPQRRPSENLPSTATYKPQYSPQPQAQASRSYPHNTRTVSPLHHAHQRRMNSIGQVAQPPQQQHQERPWALSLPLERQDHDMRYDPTAPGGWRPASRNMPQAGQAQAPQAQSRYPQYQSEYAQSYTTKVMQQPPRPPPKDPLEGAEYRRLEGGGQRSERRDGEEMGMRGASYPGMEWAPRWDGD